MTTNDAPPPGSEQAYAVGCTCPILDNAHGRGVYLLDGQPQYWIAEDCPLHGREQQEDGIGGAAEIGT